MAGPQEQQAIVRKLNLIWLGLSSSVPMIALGFIPAVTVGGVDFGNELPVPVSVLWTVITVLAIVVLIAGRLVRSRLLNSQRLASAPLSSMAREPDTLQGKAEIRVLGASMILAMILDFPGLVLIVAALYTTDVPLAVTAAVIHLLMFVPMKPDFSGLLRDTLNAMEVSC